MTSSRARSLPWTWTTAVTESSTSSAGSTTGQPARATVGSWPSRSHISSAVYGATRRQQDRDGLGGLAHGRVGRAAAGVDRLAGRVDQLHRPGDHHVEAVGLDQLLGLVHRPVGDLAQRDVAALGATCPAPR